MKLDSKVLVVTAVPAERDAVLRGLQKNQRFDVLAAGVGAVVAASNTSKVLATFRYDLVICAGTGGGFPGRTRVGSLVVAGEVVAPDLGAETPAGFSSLEKLGLGPTRFRVDAGLVNSVTRALLAAGLPVDTGPILSVSTVTGTAETAAELASRVPGAAAEAMEGFGVARAALDHGIPFLELRAISNLVGPRNRDAWRVEEALEVLKQASSVLAEVF